MIMAKHTTQFFHQIADWSNNDADDDDERDNEDIVMGRVIIIVFVWIIMMV